MCHGGSYTGSCNEGRLRLEEVVLSLLVGAQNGGQPAGGQLHVLITGRGEGEADVGAGEGRPWPLTVCNAARKHHHACLCQLQMRVNRLSASPGATSGALAVVLKEMCHMASCEHCDLLVCG